MIRFLEKIAFSVERNLKNPVFAFRAYGIIFAFCIIFFGFYGIVPLSKIIKNKLDISKELQISYDILKINIDNAKQADIDISANRDRIALLDRYMPQEMVLQTYILDFIDSIGASGYDLKSFSQNLPSEMPGQMDISLALEGSSYPINMIKNIETLKRVTQVKRVSIFQNSIDELHVSLLLTIYTFII